MAEENIITNANDVTIVVSYPGGSGSAGPQGRLLVDDFSITHSTDLTSHSGVGRHTPKGISIGDVEYEWEFTIQGEDVELFTSIVTTDSDDPQQPSGIPKEIEITAFLQDTEVGLTGAFTDEDAVEGTSGEVTEMPFSGMATGLDRGAL